MRIRIPKLRSIGRLLRALFRPTTYRQLRRTLWKIADLDGGGDLSAIPAGDRWLLQSTHVVHVANFHTVTTNIGDHYMLDAADHLLKREFPSVIRHHMPDLRCTGRFESPVIDSESIVWANQSHMMLVGPGPLFNGSEDEWKLLFPSKRPRELLDDLRVPLVLLGLGAPGSVRDGVIVPRPISERVADEIRLICARAFIISVRDPLTRDFLQGLGIENVEVTGCPTLFRFGNPPFRNDASQRDVLISYRATNPGGVDEANAALLGTVVKLIGALGHPLRLVVHDPRELQSARSLAAMLNIEAIIPKSLHDLYRMSSAAALVIAERYHGNLCAAAQGVPFISIATDGRTLSTMQMLDAEPVTLNLTGLSGEDAEERLLRLSKDALTGEGFDYARVHKRINQLGARMDAVMHQITGELRERGRMLIPS